MSLSNPAATTQEISLPAGPHTTLGDLAVPPDALGLVLFAHGSGSSRHSLRNRHVAAILQAGGHATLLFDLLTPAEERLDARTGQLRFDIPFLAHRLDQATAALGDVPGVAGLPLGYFGASTGAAAAIVAAAAAPQQLRAVVSRGGRIDLAGPAIGHLEAPLLAIVGDRDPEVLSLNKAALARVHCRHLLQVVPGAGHLFEEPGTLDIVARSARDWFTTYLPRDLKSGRTAMPDARA